MGKSVNCVVRGGEVFRELREFLGSPEPVQGIVNEVKESILENIAMRPKYSGLARPAVYWK